MQNHFHPNSSERASHWLPTIATCQVSQFVPPTFLHRFVHHACIINKCIA